MNPSTYLFVKGFGIFITEDQVSCILSHAIKFNEHTLLKFYRYLKYSDNIRLLKASQIILFSVYLLMSSL